MQGAVEVPDEVANAFAELDAAKAQLAAFTNQHAKLIEQYLRLRTEAEQRHEAAKAAYAQHTHLLGKAYGGFKVQARRGINASELVARIPDMMAYVDMSMTVKTFDALVESGKIPASAAGKFEYETEVIVSARK